MYLLSFAEGHPCEPGGEENIYLNDCQNGKIQFERCLLQRKDPKVIFVDDDEGKQVQGNSEYHF